MSRFRSSATTTASRSIPADVAGLRGAPEPVPRRRRWTGARVAPEEPEAGGVPRGLPSQGRHSDDEMASVDVGDRVDAFWDRPDRGWYAATVTTVDADAGIASVRYDDRCTAAPVPRSERPRRPMSCSPPYTASFRLACKYSRRSCASRRATSSLTTAGLNPALRLRVWP